MVKVFSRAEYHKEIGDEICGKDKCPFCDVDANWEYVTKKFKYWFLIHNKFSYSWNDRHIMAIPYAHKAFFTELKSDEIAELAEVHKFVKSWYWEQHYFSCTRESMSHRSMEHYHTHFLPWELEWKYLRKMLENQGFPIHQELDINEKKLKK